MYKSKFCMFVNQTQFKMFYLSAKSLQVTRPVPTNRQFLSVSNSLQYHQRDSLDLSLVAFSFSFKESKLVRWSENSLHVATQSVSCQHCAARSPDPNTRTVRGESSRCCSSAPLFYFFLKKCLQNDKEAEHREEKERRREGEKSFLSPAEETAALTTE